MAEGEVRALKEALADQLLLMKRLNAELEEEREASASGAEEALSMISRLQKERAEEKMEAEQYKKMAEAKMHHAEDSLEVLENFILQKEIEITSLKYQVQAYKQALLSLGITNPDIGEINVSNNRRFSRSSAFLEKQSSLCKVKRQISLPAIRFDKLLDTIDGDGSLLPTLQSAWMGVSDHQNQFKECRRQPLSMESVIEECDSDLEQTPRVNTSAFLRTKSFQQEVRSNYISSNNEVQMKTIDPWNFEEDRSCFGNSTENHGMPNSSCLEAGSTRSTIQSVGVQSMFELPTSHNGWVVSESKRAEAEDMMGVPGTKSREAVNYFVEDDDISNKAFKFRTMRKCTTMNYRSTLVEPKVGIFPLRTEVAQLKDRIQQLEDDVNIIKQDNIKKCTKEPNLLREIRLYFSKKPSPEDEAMFHSLSEAMLSIWI